MAELILNISKKLYKNIEKNAKFINLTKERYIRQLLEREVIDVAYIKPQIVEKGLPVLVDLLSKIPAINIMSSDIGVDGRWWIKFNIDISHKLAWHVVQGLGFILNYISLTELLPTVFKPVSPPPYLNSGPDECLSWVIESQIAFLDPSYIASVIAERLPHPLDDENQWLSGDAVDNVNHITNNKTGFVEKVSKFFGRIVGKK